MFNLSNQSFQYVQVQICFCIWACFINLMCLKDFRFVNYVVSRNDFFYFQMLSTVLNIIMFEDCRNQWSMSRPLLGLILLNEEVGNARIYFTSFRQSFLGVVNANHYICLSVLISCD